MPLNNNVLNHTTLKYILKYSLAKIHSLITYTTSSFLSSSQNPAENVKKLAKFLEIDISDAICEDIAEACSFENLKKNAEFKTRDHPPHHHPNREVNGDEQRKPRHSRSYRKGQRARDCREDLNFCFVFVLSHL